jgi:hypothetical protein
MRCPQSLACCWPKPEKKSAPIPLNFLLGCSATTIDNLRLAHMGLAANLRKELLLLVDKLVDEMVLIELALWFKENDREALKRALETEEDAATWAKRMIRGGHDVLPRWRKYADPTQAHRIAAQNYRQRNIAEGKCECCPEPLDRNSTQHCTKHLEQKRNRQREQSKNLGKCPRGRHPNTITALERSPIVRGSTVGSRRPSGLNPVQNELRFVDCVLHGACFRGCGSSGAVEGCQFTGG